MEMEKAKKKTAKKKTTKKKTKYKAKTQAEIYKTVNDRIMDMIEKGSVPWDKPWHPATNGPMNFMSKKGYRGVNIWVLMSAGFDCKYWATFSQIKKLGGKIKKGESAWPIVYWNFRHIKKEDEDTGEEETTTIPMLKQYAVFNLEQTEGIDIPSNEEFLLTEFEDNTAAEDIVANWQDKPVIHHKEQDRAFYRPSEDSIWVPVKKQFKSEDEYYSTLFHEMIHATGHKKRLARQGVTQASMFGGHEYSKEELVAEFGSSFLRGVAGIENDKVDRNSAAYLKGWLKALENNPKWLVSAAGKAQKAADYILGIHNQQEETEALEG